MSVRDNFVIYRDVPVLTRKKEYHVRKMHGRLRYSFIVSVGDVPVASFNSITNKYEQVLNTRGFAYAARGRQMYQPNRKKFIY